MNDEQRELQQALDLIGEEVTYLDHVEGKRFFNGQVTMVHYDGLDVYVSIDGDSGLVYYNKLVTIESVLDMFNEEIEYANMRLTGGNTLKYTITTILDLANQLVESLSPISKQIVETVDK